jgi:hypothetical protein
VVLYLRARRTQWALVSYVGILAIAVVTVTTEISMPNIVSGGSGKFPVPILLPLVPATILSLTVAAPDPRLEHGGVPPLRGLRVAHAFVLLAAGVVALLPYARQDIYAESVRALIGYTGFALVGSARWGPDRGWMLAIVPTLVGTLFARPNGRVAGWAWFMHPAAHVASWVVALGVGALGVGLLAWRDQGLASSS